MLYTVTAHVGGHDPVIVHCYCDSDQTAYETGCDICADRGYRTLSVHVRPVTDDERDFCRSATREVFGDSGAE